MKRHIRIIVVVILFSIPIAIFVWPALLHEGSTSRRTKYVRTAERELAAAIEAYRADHHAYPAMHPMKDFAMSAEDLGQLHEWGGDDLDTVEPGSGKLAGLTTPIPYIPKVPYELPSWRLDAPLAYYTDGKGWILFSCGPNRRYDVRPQTDYDSQSQAKLDFLLHSGLNYDPTNGLLSRGDIIMLSK